MVYSYDFMFMLLLSRDRKSAQKFYTSVLGAEIIDIY